MSDKLQFVDDVQTDWLRLEVEGWIGVIDKLKFVGLKKVTKHGRL